MRIPFVSISLLSFVTAVAVAAESGADPADRAKAVAPFIDETTVAVVRLDASRLAPEAVWGKLAGLAPELAQAPDELLENAKKMHTAFTQAGGRDLYVVVSLTDLFTEPWFVVVPLSKNANADALSEFLGTGCEACQKFGGALAAGRKATLQRLSQLQPDPRPELETALAAAGDAAITAILLPPKYSGRVIEQMMPMLPKEIGGGPSRTLTQGIRWATLSVDAAPQASARLVIQSQDAPAAQALRDKWIEAHGLLASEAVRRELPPLSAAVEFLKPDVQQDRLVLHFDESDGRLPTLLDAMYKSVREARKQASRSATMNQLKQIGLAFHVYHDAHKGFPAAASYSADGQPLLSWRVHLLPFLDQQELYAKFHLNEPWDNPHNRALIDQMPAVYRSPASQVRERGLTNYLVPVGPDTIFPGRESTSISDLGDGASNTILAVEVADRCAVVWTKPDDLAFDPAAPAQDLGGMWEGGFMALFADGSVQFLALPAEANELVGKFTRGAQGPKRE